MLCEVLSMLKGPAVVSSALGRKVLLVAGVAQAATQLQGVGNRVVQRTEGRIRGGTLVLRGIKRILRIARRQAVKADAVDLDVFLEVEQAGNPLPWALAVRLGA